jgi:anti-anti-sigma factor
MSVSSTALYVDDVCVLRVEERVVAPRRIAITVVGDLDHATCTLLDGALSRTFEGRPAAVSIDLRLAAFLSAGGLRVLLVASRKARQSGVLLTLQTAPGLVTRILVLVGLGGELEDPPADDVTSRAGRRHTLQLVTPWPDDGVTEDETPGRPGSSLLRTAPVPTDHGAAEAVAAAPEGLPQW